MENVNERWPRISAENWSGQGGVKVNKQKNEYIKTQIDQKSESGQHYDVIGIHINA